MTASNAFDVIGFCVLHWAEIAAVCLAATRIFEAAKKSFRNRRIDDLKNTILFESASLIGYASEHNEKLQTVLDKIQEKCPITSKIPDQQLIELINSVYVNKVKPVIKDPNIDTDKPLTVEQINEIFGLKK